jgi:macrophage erythroblast attacher
VLVIRSTDDVQKLYDRSRWHDIRLKFRETFLSLYALPSQPVLSLALSAGLSALRLPSCAAYKPAEGAGNSNSTTPKSPVIPLLPAAPPLHSIEDTLFPGNNSFIMTEQGVVSFRNDRQGLADAAFGYPGHGQGHGQGHLGQSGTGQGPSATGQRTHGAEHTLKEELHEHPDMPVGNVDCPTCGPDMKVLAAECAMSHHVNSTIVCRISGKVMDSENEPMAFPNGYVYSSKVCYHKLGMSLRCVVVQEWEAGGGRCTRVDTKGRKLIHPQALQEMAKNNFDIVTCPRTGESCSFSRLRKVYIS